MKKIIALLLSFLLMCVLGGCGGAQTTDGNEITDLYNQGYEASNTSYDETSWAGIFQKDGGWDSVFLVTAGMTPEKYEELSAIGFDDEDYDAKQREFLGKLTDVTVTDITDKIPGQDELDKYIGMTIGELENEGFERSGFIGDPETGYEFFVDGPDFTVTVAVEGGETMGDMDNYSENDIRGLKISAVRFTGVSSKILEG